MRMTNISATVVGRFSKINPIELLKIKNKSNCEIHNGLQKIGKFYKIKMFFL
jgi:hypothetical protein